MTKYSLKVGRSRHGSCIDQMADALKSAIESGYYKHEKVLPTLDELAAEFGVSFYVPRAAVKRLADEGTRCRYRALREGARPRRSR